MVKGNNSSSYNDNWYVDEFWFIFVSLWLSMQQQGKYLQVQYSYTFQSDVPDSQVL